MTTQQQAALARLISESKLDQNYILFENAVVVADGFNRSFILYEDGSMEKCEEARP